MTKPSLPRSTAPPIAERIAEGLRDVCARVAIAGSLRRGRSHVGDIEIVAKVVVERGGLFGDELTPLLEPVRHVLSCHGELGKNGTRYIEVLDVGGVGVKADVFLVHPPAEWGTILAIRTGPSELSQWAVTRMRRLSRRCVDGHVETKDGERIPTPTEAAFFRAAGLDCLPPEDRESREARLPAEVGA